MNIYLIRHGQKQDDARNDEAVELSSQGFKQAGLLGQRMKIFNIEALFASPMVRAVQTSQEINKFLDVEIIIREGIREINMGECETRGWTYVKENYPGFMKEFSAHENDIPYPGGECGQDVWKRAMDVMKEITESKYENVAVVTHGGVIRVLISGILGLGQEKRFYLGAPLECCSISRIIYEESSRKFYIQSFNDCAHLEGLRNEDIPMNRV